MRLLGVAREGPGVGLGPGVVCGVCVPNSSVRVLTAHPHNPPSPLSPLTHTPPSSHPPPPATAHYRSSSGPTWPTFRAILWTNPP
jgi:hypothetical protein